MALEHEQTIRARRHKGRTWRQIMQANSMEKIALDYGLFVTSLTRIMKGEFQTDRLTDEDFKQILRRRRLFRHAEYRWRKDSDARLKAEYRMSTDTLNKILDRAPETPSPVAYFLQGRF